MKTTKRNKLALIIIPFAGAAATFSACGGEPVNQGPELRGVNDITCLTETGVDLLGNVAALDEEDGDITRNIEISVTPQVTVNDGYAVFNEVGDYEVCYEVRDSGGKLARSTAYVSAVEREEYNSALFTNGFSVSAGGGASVISEGISGDSFAFKSTGGNIAEDIRLSRTYSLKYGTEYNFEYTFTSNLKGRIGLAADGEKFGEAYVAAGENRLSFKHTIERPAMSAAEATDVTIQLWLGGLEGELEAAIKKVDVESAENEELLPDFNFTNRVNDRFDNDGGALVLNASSEITDGGKGVKLNVTETTSPDMWRGGVFVNTGLTLVDWGNYAVSFDLSAKNNKPYEVLLLCNQWGDNLFTVNGGDGRKEAAFTIDGAHDGGTLWLYIQSGNNVNEITLKNLSVKGKKSRYGVNGFTCGGGEIKSEYGKAVYTVKNFGSGWGENEMGSPVLNIPSGSAENFVIQFRAKASKNLNVVFAATLSLKWDTFVWKNFDITEEERRYSIQCNSKAGLKGLYKLVWQFGNSANNEGAPEEGVAVEIWDIKICYKDKALGDNVDE